ncbi:hypothetical protein G6011_07716 [Alternaria panax]|uniref:Copper transport protein n=1 Tax=Alternaria panax TaxID=48097 RepID=A0AAD4I4N2_9PLEO|nr:hypothetical protein G6011_07716 [Alternaria panax]
MAMNMDMPSATSTGARTHMGAQSSISPMNMSGMASTFSSSTRVTLWFTEWTTTTTATYVLTIFFLLFLGILNRFLSAFKSQLEMKWRIPEEVKSAISSIPNTEKLDRSVRGHARQWSRALRQQPLELDEKQRQEIEPLSPAESRLLAVEEAGISPDRSVPPKSFWVVQAPWSIKTDGVSAALEFVRALIGYVLYVFGKNYGKDDRNTNGSLGYLPS